MTVDLPEFDTDGMIPERPGPCHGHGDRVTYKGR
jgi:hypothetical protein